MPVVYDGVNGNGDGQGDLFQGLKLWIAHRVPLRSKYVDLVKGNGGQVVQLEKNADMLIADHIKKGGISAPDGSYSWQWIDFSVKNGHLQDKEDYLIRAEARTVGSSQPVKGRRTAFNANDDFILTRWVMANERNGSIASSGNEIYKEFEKKHPHHTWQSWRDRWVKRLSDRPRPNIPEDDLELDVAEDQPPPKHSTAAVNPPARATRSARPAQPVQPAQPDPEQEPEAGPSTPQRRAPKPKATTPASSNRATGRGRVFFTDQEDQLLLAFIQKAKAHNEALSGNRIYQQFAENHPRHSWHSWRDRWLRHLSLREAVDDDGPDDQSNAAPAKAEGPCDDNEPQMTAHGNVSKRRRLVSITAASNTVIEVPGTAGAASATPGPGVASTRPNPKSDEERLRRQEENRKKARVVTWLQSAWRGHAVRRELKNAEAAFVPLQAMMRGYVARKRRYAEANAAGNAFEGAGEGSVRSDGEPRPDRAERREFYDDLQNYIEVSGANVKHLPSIGGHVIDLWDLFRVATLQDCQPDERKWARVAEDLGYDSSRSKLVVEIHELYQQNLADFEEHIRAFDNDDDFEQDPEEEEEVGRDAAAGSLLLNSDAVTAPKEPLADPSSPAYPSSPLRATRKRSRQHSELLSFELGYPSSGSRKRRRLHENEEVPSTPEDNLESARSRHRLAAPHGPSSPLQPRGVANDDAIAISSGEESDDLLDEEMEDAIADNELPSHAEPPRKTYFEPETQDWRFEKDDISPSQQLQLESNAFQSPDRVIPSRKVAGQLTTNSPSPTITGSRGAGYTGARTRPVKALKSSLAPEGSGVSGTHTSSPTVVGKAPNRTHPPQYQHKPTSVTPALAPAAKPAWDTVGQTRTRPKPSSPVRAPGTAAVRPTNGSTPRPRPSDAPTATPGAQRSSSSRTPAVSTPARPTMSSRKDPSSRRGEDVDYDQDYIEAQIQHFEALGYKTRHISQALEAATLQRGPMIAALKSLAEGHGIPPNEQGIWTSRDNDELRMIVEYGRRVENGNQPASSGTDSRMRTKVWAARNRLEAKHGKEGPGGFDSRTQFLKLMDAGEGQQA